MRIRIATFWIVLFALAVSANAQKVGDTMPPLNVTDWITGDKEQVGTWGDGKVYVLELWGTWCEPCKAMLPKLTRLQADYKDEGLIVIGYSWEEPDILRKFTNEFRKDIGYVIVGDTQSKTIDALNENEAVEGFPYAFLIGRDGKVVWKGNSKKLPLATELYFAGKPIEINDGPF